MRPGQAIDLRGRCRFPNLWHIAFDQSRPRILGRFEKMGENMFDSSNGTRFAGHCVVDVWGTLDHEATKQPRLVHRSSVHSFLCLNFPKHVFIILKTLKHVFRIGPFRRLKTDPSWHSSQARRCSRWMVTDRWIERGISTANDRNT